MSSHDVQLRTYQGFEVDAPLVVGLGPATNLPQPGDTRSHAEVGCRRIAEALHLLPDDGSRPDQAHLPRQDVDELR